MKPIAATDVAITNGCITITFDCASLPSIEEGPVAGVPEYLREALLENGGRPVTWLMEPRVYSDEDSPTTFGVAFTLGVDYIEDVVGLDEAIGLLEDIKELLPDRQLRKATALLKRAAADWWEASDAADELGYLSFAELYGVEG